ncbi:MAG: ABC transporter ATP-binding protein [Candidatus Buchananbacteria bacterium RIFCSPHIGHO2_01_FULL_47_11b]|uniref:ABC transporter ATP-binding protein n=1 Tax=Candidatus Buchananbacteria bacterium RIFCSPHIGHO2_01_FULL_47_11b TaxID=1797537 RepID=A0A1G1Y3M4_9BACT|nr:MAG: ABC transporter ATP-binding protein [Candidatus Buchananbacteria bacterium RIFCSPHIGHO2_01_FULL_47_11b]
MKLLWRYVSQHKKFLFGALGLATVNQFFSLLDPQMMRLLIDRYATKAGEIEFSDFITGVVFLLFLYVSFAFISRTAKAFQDYFANVITQRVGAQLYADSVDHSFSLPFGVFEDERSGELLQKLEKARTDNQLFIASAINVVFLTSIGALFVIAYAFWVHWSIGLSYLLLFPVLATTIYFLSRKIKEKQKQIVAEQADMAGSTTETLRNVELVKSLGLETQEVSRLNAVNEKILKLELQKVRMVRTLSFIQGTAINFIRSLLTLLMFYLIFQQAMTLGEFFTLFVYSFFVFGPLWELGSVITQYQDAKAANEQLEAVFARPAEPKPKNPHTVGQLTSITLNGVAFSYQHANQPAVSGVNLEITGGQTVAFVGPSGSGKSTIIKLLVGLYKPTAGELRYNGIDCHQIDFEKFRKRIGLVAQETQLFAGTIRENLLFVNPRASDKDCLNVLHQAAADSILQRAKAGLDTKIGEGGLKLSGGERQRLAIARALLRNPELIIFDEATSSLDSITEKSITETIRQVEKSRPNLITILVAHRLSTINHAEKIYVLEKGKIIETGNHAQLVTKGGLYAALWRQQTASEDKPPISR